VDGDRILYRRKRVAQARLGEVLRLHTRGPRIIPTGPRPGDKGTASAGASAARERSGRLAELTEAGAEAGETGTASETAGEAR
jgi:hypothetical protein